MNKKIIALLEEAIIHAAMIQSNCRKPDLVIKRAEILAGSCGKHGILHQALTLLKQQPPAGQPKCKTCRDRKKIEVCDTCYPNKTIQIMQQIDSYPKLIRCVICGKGKPKEISCPDCQQPPAGEFTKKIRDYIADFIYAEQHGVEMQHKPCCLEKDLIEACDIIDAAEAINKIKDKRIAEFEVMVKVGGECCDILQERIDILSEGKERGIDNE